jgi:peptidoglycan/xylan/chitin deacetylase (PgdA/CDA1 family)
MPDKTAQTAPANLSSNTVLGMKGVARQFAANALHHTGLMRGLERLARTYELRPSSGSRVPVLRRRTAPKFAILGYHRVGTSGVPLFSRLEPNKFAAHMRYVKSHYRVVPLGQLCQELRAAEPVKPTVAITFDDGYRDLHTYAFPVLRKYQIPATVYLIGRCMETGEVPWYDRIFLALRNAPGDAFDVQLDTLHQFPLRSAQDRIQAAWQIVCYLRSVPDDRRRAWCASFEKSVSSPQAELEERMLTWDQVREMHKQGISFGAHTMSHPAVSQLERSAFEREFLTSRKLLETGLDASMPDFAYPFGKPSDQSPAVEEFLARNGYRSAVTTVDGYNTPDTSSFKLRRLQIDDGDSLASFALTLGRLFLESSDEPAAEGRIRRKELAARAEPRGGSV